MFMAPVSPTGGRSPPGGSTGLIDRTTPDHATADRRDGAQRHNRARECRAATEISIWSSNMRCLIAAICIAVGAAGCAPLEPAALSVSATQAVASLPTDPPISLLPDSRDKSNDIVIARPDPRLKYRTSPDCHYVNYDGSCKS